MKRYFVYRVFTQFERPNSNERHCYYGWSISKSVIKAFMQQRNPKKYEIIKIDDEKLSCVAEDLIDDNYMIDFIKVRSARTNEEVTLFITRNELKECEMSIQSMIIEQASLSNIDGDGNYLDMFLHLKDHYVEALYMLGCRPKEIDILFPSADYHDDYASFESLEDAIENAYDDPYKYPEEEVKHMPMEIPGLHAAIDIGNKLYYSLESFIAALRDDL